MKINTKLALLFLVAAQVGCGSWQDAFKAPPKEERSWSKTNVSLEETRITLVSQCGYIYTGWTVAQQADVDRCMLGKGFEFIDVKHAGRGVCDSPLHQQLPSCQSLKHKWVKGAPP